jgi:hypothetical protein
MNPECRDSVLPLVVSYDKQAQMEKFADITSMLKKIERLLPPEVKKTLAKYIGKLQSASWETVYDGIIRQLSNLGKKLGFPKLGALVDRGIRKLSLRKLMSLIVSYVRGGYEALMDFFNITPPPAAGALRVARDKEAMDPLMAISALAAILIVVAATIFILGNLGDDFFSYMVAHDVLEGAGKVLGGLIGILLDSLR